ncbi:MAG: alpha-amylase, partial [Alistipes sp.]|nr:alpha-amylase [Candidatus Minthomonas equi]
MNKKPEGKFIIYQMLLRVFGNTNRSVPGGSLSVNGSGKFADIDFSILKSIRKLSVSYIWFTGVIRHSTYPEPEVKGMAGSPYAISDYADVNPYLAVNAETRLMEFSEMVSRVHSAGMGVILDFVPNHVSCNYDNRSSFKFTEENFYPGRYHDGDWTDTVKLNYSNRNTWEKMRDILLLWCSRGADGFRCDMAELVPPDFWSWCIPKIKAAYPETLFIAEVYQPDRYREFLSAGFDYLYDKSCFYDTLFAILKNEWSASSLTGAWQRLGDIQPRMLNFMENHDEPRLSSPFVCGDPFRGIAATAASLLFNNAPFMLYFGQEIGEDGMESAGFSGSAGRTTSYDWGSIPCVIAYLKGRRKGN